MTEKTDKRYVYKVTGSCMGVVGSYYDSMDAAFDFIRMLKAGYRGDPSKFHIYIHVNDERVVEWDEASCAVQSLARLSPVLSARSRLAGMTGVA